MTNKANQVTHEKEYFQKQLNMALLELETARSSLEKANEQRHTDFEQMENNAKKYKDENDVILYKLESVLHQLEKTKRLLKSKEEEIWQFKLEKTQTKAKVAGERMVNGNTAITDLSDREWQQKLSEMFVSLYDDSWTDAFEVVKDYHKNDQHACQQLLLIFQNCWAFCVQYSKSQLEALQLTYIKAGDKGENTKREILETYPSQLIKLIQDTRHYFVQDFLPRLQQIYWTQNKTNLSESLRPYVQACLQLCWYSAISDPALHYVFTADNLEHFRPFTQIGNDIVYVVWPALLLHENGPLLLKGVVQFNKLEENEQ